MALHAMLQNTRTMLIPLRENCSFVRCINDSSSSGVLEELFPICKNGICMTVFLTMHAEDMLLPISSLFDKR